MDATSRKIVRIGKATPDKFYKKVISKLQLLSRTISEEDAQIVQEFIDEMRKELLSGEYSKNTIDATYSLMMSICDSYDMSNNMKLSIITTTHKMKLIKYLKG